MEDRLKVATIFKENKDISFIHLLKIDFYLSGVVLSSLSIFGFFANFLTLYILNCTKEMRHQPINMYLTALAIYDKGVLLNAIFIFGIPAFAKNFTAAQNLTIDYNITNKSNVYNLSSNNFIIKTDASLSQINFFNNTIIDNSKNFDKKTFEKNETNIFNNQNLENIGLNITDNNLSFFMLSINKLENFFASRIKIIYPLANIFQTGSIWLTCLITAERYLVVCHPFRALTLSTKFRAIISILLVTICAILFNITRFAEITVKYNYKNSNYEIRKSNLRLNKVYYWFYYIFLNLTLLYVIPLILLTYLNIKIYSAIRTASKNRSSLTRSQKGELNIATMLVIIVVVFISCNSTMFVVNLMELFEAPYLQICSSISNVLVCFNSSTNFVIYTIFGKKFRANLKNAFICFKNKKNQPKKNIRNKNKEKFKTVNQSNLSTDKANEKPLDFYSQTPVEINLKNPQIKKDSFLIETFV